MSLSLPIIGYKMSGGSCGSANTVMYCTSSANGCFTTRASTCCGCGASYCYGCPSGTSCTTVSSSYYCVKDSVPMWTPPPVYIYHPYSPTPYYTGTPYSSGAPCTRTFSRFYALLKAIYSPHSQSASFFYRFLVTTATKVVIGIGMNSIFPRQPPS